MGHRIRSYLGEDSVEGTWRFVDGWRERYEVSDLGRVRNHSTGRILKRYDHGDGYLAVTLSYCNKHCISLVHRLVFETLVGQVPNGMVVHHIDHDRRNATLRNLELVTLSKNNTKQPGRGKRMVRPRRVCSFLTYVTDWLTENG